MLKRMSSKSIQSTWCYRYKLLSLWISTIYFWIILHSLYFENVLQEYACTGVGWGVRPKRIFEYRGGWGVQKWSFWGVRTLWMAPKGDIAESKINLIFSCAILIFL